MKYNLTLMILFLTILSCVKEKPKKKFTLKGKITGESPEYIYMQYGNIKDSSRIINNEFQFNGKVKYPINARFIIQPASSINRPFYLENNNINVNISVIKRKYKKIEITFIQIDTVFGTETSEISYNFDEFRKNHKLDEDWSDKLYKQLEQIIIENPANHYSGDLLAEISEDTILSDTRLKNLYKKIDTINQAKYVIEILRKKLYPKTTIKVGSDMFNFRLPNKNNILISTAKYRGSTLLIDFWASWCAPCRKQNPGLLKIYNEFKDDGFEILGVSIDKDKNKWLKAIKDDGLIWENVIEINGTESEILAKYDAIYSIPRNVLIDSKGRIVSKDISTKELRMMLQEKAVKLDK